MNSLVNAATILGTFISAATFMFVLYDWWRERKGLTGVVWNVIQWGAETDGDGEKNGDCISITNAGSETALVQGISIAHGQAVGHGGKLISSWTLSRGDTIELVVSGFDPEKTWIIVTWVSAADRFNLYWEWFSPVLESTLMSESTQSAKRQRSRIRKRLRRKRNVQIGPGAWKSSYCPVDKLDSQEYSEAWSKTQIPLPSSIISPSGVTNLYQTQPQGPEPDRPVSRQS